MKYSSLAPLWAALVAALVGCGAVAQSGPNTGVGPNPQLPAPTKQAIPTVHIAPAEGWPQGAHPTPAAGFGVTAFATALDHPRWVYVLPNGDVLVAESNAPPKPEDGKGIKGKVMKLVMKKAGAGVPSANRITLLRDANGDGIAETKTVFMQGLNSPFGMALVGNELFIANSDAIVKVPYETGQTSITAAPVKVTDLPAGPLNHHWTKNIIASPDGSKLYATVGSNSNVAENGIPAEGWPQGAHPTPAAGFGVTAFATALDHPRWVYVLPNGDVLVAESNAPPKPEDGKGIKGKVMKLVMKKAGAGVPSANRITLLRDANGDGIAETKTVFMQGLNSPFGMALVGNELFIANSDAIVKVPYETGQTSITAAPVKVTDLPAGPLNHHWTKNIIASPDGSKLYATVGSNSNVAENGIPAEEGRAAIWEVDRATGSKRLFATGLRNPNGMAWEPQTHALWTVVNERDELGNDLVPDYLTSVKDGAFYGWPWSYWGQNVDARVKPARSDMVAKAIKPDYGLGSHVAPLGLTFSDARSMPQAFASGAFVGEHGSWNRKPRSGYKVVFIPFEAGKPAREPVDFLTGFVSREGKAWGRPVGVAMDGKGGVLVADDVGNAIWRVAAAR